MTGACKLDGVSPQGSSTATDQEIIMGITLSGSDVHNGYLTAKWKAIRTVQQYYDTSYVVVSGSIMQGKFASVALNDNMKSFEYQGLSTNTSAATGTYSLAIVSNVLYLRTPGNPFFSNPASTVRITNLTSAAMTWVAMDGALTNVNGQMLREAYQVMFVR